MSRDIDERQPWDRRDGEAYVRHSWFNIFRLMGPGRTLNGAYKLVRAQQGKIPGKNAPGSWRRMADEDDWWPRAEAWDKWVIDQADKKWREQIMGEAELLARLSQMGRASISDFVETEKGGRMVYINERALKERGHLVKRVATSTGKTNSVSLGLHDPQTAMMMLGKHMRIFTDEERLAAGAASFSLPADLISPQFLNAYRDIRDHQHTEYLFYGGRGSTKSTFVSLVILYLLKNNPEMHALAARQVANTLKDSVYSQFLWSISELGLDNEFKCTLSPLEITYLPTGQKIYFRGADDPGKIKSIKPAFGYIGILWFEELDQFHGEEAIRKIEQSVIRGGDLAYIFKSFNPPRTAANWANKYVKIPKNTQYQHQSCYLEVPPEWLGKVFLEEADHLKVINPKAYEHEYLGIANGTGGLVFENVQFRKITDDEISQFDHVLMGNDWGYYPDPYAWVKCHYDAARLTLYIYDELRALKASNRQTADMLISDKHVLPSDLIISDSAEPKSVADYREYGLTCRGAEKGPESVKYSMKWLQSLAAIVIDHERCPYAAEEFINYELEQDPDGNFISEYPDRDNHFIDATRYATNLIWRRRGS
jgi:PBSX family phage terminase large subunit